MKGRDEAKSGSSGLGFAVLQSQVLFEQAIATSRQTWGERTSMS